MRKRGKKIDVLHIEEGAQRHAIELRWDRNDGYFFAVLGSVEFGNKTLQELKDKLHEHAKTLVEYEYSWYLQVHFSLHATRADRRVSYSYGVDWEDVGDDEVVTGLGFNFGVIERSQAIKTGEKDYRGRPYWLRMSRIVEEVDGELRAVGKLEAERFVEDNNADLLEFTPERYEKLKAIRAAMKELARRLHEIVGGDAEALAKVLDSLPKQPLALAPAMPQKKARS